MLDKIIKGISSRKKNRSEIFELIKELMDRKKKLFPHVSRMILEFKVTDLGDDFHIAIASTLGKQK